MWEYKQLKARLFRIFGYKNLVWADAKAPAACNSFSKWNYNAALV